MPLRTTCENKYGDLIQEKAAHLSHAGSLQVSRESPTPRRVISSPAYYVLLLANMKASISLYWTSSERKRARDGVGVGGQALQYLLSGICLSPLAVVCARDPHCSQIPFVSPLVRRTSFFCLFDGLGLQYRCSSTSLLCVYFISRILLLASCSYYSLLTLYFSVSFTCVSLVCLTCFLLT